MFGVKSHSPGTFESEALALLDSLKDAHEALLSALRDLRLLTLGPPPTIETLNHIRWTVSKASLERRLLWGRIHFHLSRHVDARAEADLFRLQEIDMALLRSTSAHLTGWAPARVLEDWSGYAHASGVMQGKMIAAINTEKRLLYPLLEGAGTSSLAAQAS
jgi:hypothetical protein